MTIEDVNCLKCTKCDTVNNCPELRESKLIDWQLAIQREIFEKWARGNGFHTSMNIHSDYKNSKLNWMWKAWLAAINNI
jgi:hypothetical protein